MNRDEATYGGIRRKYDDWVELEKTKPIVAQEPPAQRPYTPHHEHADMGKTVFAAIGFGIAAILLLLAVWSFFVASQWAALEREGAATGYTLVGIFLLIAGTGGILATWNHNFRVLTRPAGHH